jgi:hypothetical protein
MKTHFLSLLILVSLTLAGFFSSVANAGPESSVLTAEDEAVKQRARRRSYIGGADEEPLKVQAQLPILKSRNEAPDESRPSSEESD